MGWCDQSHSEAQVSIQYEDTNKMKIEQTNIEMIGNCILV